MENITSVYTKMQLAEEYGVDRRTFYRWLEPIKDEIGKVERVYNPRQLALIFRFLGKPDGNLSGRNKKVG